MKRKRKDGGIIERVTHTVTKRTGVIRLDKKTMTFFALDPDIDETPDTRGTISEFESKDGREVWRWLYHERLSKNLKPDKPLDWKPVIEVKVTDHDSGRYGYGRRTKKHVAGPGDEEQERESAVTAEIDRYFIALTANKKEWRKLEWHEVADGSSTKVPVEDQLAKSSKYADGPKVEMPKESWASKPSVFALPSIRDGKSIVAYTEDLWLGLNQLFDNLDKTVSTIQDMLGTKQGLTLIAEVGSGVKRIASGAMATEDVAADAVVETPPAPAEPTT